MLRDLAAALRQVRPPLPPYTERGDWRLDIDAGIPSSDRPRPFSFRRQIMPRSQFQLPLHLYPEGVSVASLNYYPAGGSGVGWHTDSSNPGWRVYLGLPMGPGRGIFLTRDRFIVDDEEYATAFRVDAESWHAVETSGPRLSAGLRLKGLAARLMLGLPS